VIGARATNGLLCPIRYQLTRERLMAAAEGNVEAVAEELARIYPETVRRPS